MKRAENIGYSWCNNQINQLERAPIVLTSKYNRIRMPENETPILMAYAERIEKPDGKFECNFVITGGLFPTLHTYKSENGEWEIYD